MEVINSLMHTAPQEIAQAAAGAAHVPSHDQAVRAALEDRTRLVKRTFVFRANLSDLPDTTLTRKLRSGTDGAWICLVETYPDEAGIDLCSVQASGRMWNVFPQDAVIIPDLSRIPGKEIGPPFPEVEPVIIVLSKILSPVTIHLPIFNRGRARDARSHSENIDLLQKWLGAEASPLIAIIETMDNGFYQLPAVIKRLWYRDVCLRHVETLHDLPAGPSWTTI